MRSLSSATSLFFSLLAYLIYLWRSEKRRANWSLAILLGFGLVIFLWVLSWVLGWVAYARDPAFVAEYLGSQGGLSPSAFFAAAMSRRFTSIAGLLTLLAVLIPSIAFLAAYRRRGADDPMPAPPVASKPAPARPASTVAVARPPHSEETSAFIFVLIIIGAVLVIAPDFVFLRDQFNSRLNTIFKFY